MKRFVTSMQGRVFLVIIGGIVASALLTATLADLEGRRTFAQVRAAHTADRVEQLVGALEAVPPEVRPTLVATLGRGMTARFAAPDAARQANDVELTNALIEELGQDRHLAAFAGHDLFVGESALAHGLVAREGAVLPEINGSKNRFRPRPSRGTAYNN